MPKLSYLITLTLIGICSLIGHSSKAQVLLQLERYKVDRAVKFAPGQEITFQLNDYPDEWRTEKIERIMYEDSLIITSAGLVHLSDISHFRLYNKKVYYIAQSLKTFALTWVIYGGIIALTTESDIGPGQFIFGGSVYLAGYLLKKLFYHSDYKLGKKHRLRIIDITWPEPVLRP